MHLGQTTKLQMYLRSKWKRRERVTVYVKRSSYLETFPSQNNLVCFSLAIPQDCLIFKSAGQEVVDY